MSETPLHPDLAPLAYLFGDWHGQGEGLWAAFDYEDSLSFQPDPHGRPLVSFAERTHVPDGAPSHGEVGYLTAAAGGSVHMTVAEPSGITEALAGRVAEDALVLTSTEIGHAPGSRNVTATARRITLDGDRLVVEVDVAMNGEALAPHTRSVLQHGGGAAQ